VSELNTEPPLAIEQVFRDQRVALIRLAYLLTGSRDQAEDIVQTAFAAAHRRWSGLDDPLAYLRRVVVNRAQDLHRRRFRRPPPPDVGITQQPEIDETWAELVRLPASQRAVVVLRFYEDLPLTDIARMLDRPEGTVRSDLHRALARLRRTLA
jgi:RNA polymerase sigma factor (sigma-70 family)